MVEENFDTKGNDCFLLSSSLVAPSLAFPCFHGSCTVAGPVHGPTANISFSDFICVFVRVCVCGCVCYFLFGYCCLFLIPSAHYLHTVR